MPETQWRRGDGEGEGGEEEKKEGSKRMERETRALRQLQAEQNLGFLGESL